jgi:phosphatidylserine decarboxylase
MRLHREGNASILLVVTLGSLATAASVLYAPPALAWLVAALSLAALALILNFFRYPQRPLQQQADAVLAPSHGKVVVIEAVEDPELGPARQISIFMSPLDVHVNYSPVAGTVETYAYRQGQYLMAFNPKSSLLNEQTWLVINSRGSRVGVKQIAGFLARRIKCYAQAGNTLQQAEEFGFIKFGSRLDVLIPLDWQVQVQLGQRTQGGQTVLARRTS